MAHYPYEGTDVVSVHASEEGAEKIKAKIERRKAAYQKVCDKADVSEVALDRWSQMTPPEYMGAELSVYWEKVNS
jgi:hypothetical protein